MPSPGPEETTDPVTADKRNFYKVEQWDADDHIVAMPFAGTSLDKAREVFGAEVKRLPADRFTIRQRGRVAGEVARILARRLVCQNDPGRGVVR